MFPKLRSILIPFVTICFILGAAASVIAYGRGYRLDVTKKSLAPTGLLTATSDPTGAQILINGRLFTATNTTLSLSPDWYTVQIVKERYQTWEKKIRVQGEVVSRADAFLIPTNPSLTALTTNGVLSPAVSPDGTKIAFITPPDPSATFSSELVDRSGIWVLDLIDRSLGFNRDARLLSKAKNFRLNNATLSWSPDSKQILLTIAATSYLLDTDKEVVAPSIVPSIELLLKQWKGVKLLKEKEQRASLPQALLKTVDTGMQIISFSPDETKILYEATAAATIPTILEPPLIGTNPTPQERSIKLKNVYVYDIKEDKNYLLGDRSLPSLQWLPTSRHLLLVKPNAIQIMEYDGANRKTVYSGPFTDGYVWPWTNGSKILILTSLNSTTALSNLYTINLR